MSEGAGFEPFPLLSELPVESHQPLWRRVETAWAHLVRWRDTFERWNKSFATGRRVEARLPEAAFRFWLREWCLRLFGPDPDSTSANDIRALAWILTRLDGIEGGRLGRLIDEAPEVLRVFELDRPIRRDPVVLNEPGLPHILDAYLIEGEKATARGVSLTANSKTLVRREVNLDTLLIEIGERILNENASEDLSDWLCRFAYQDQKPAKDRGPSFRQPLNNVGGPVRASHVSEGIIGYGQLRLPYYEPFAKAWNIDTSIGYEQLPQWRLRALEFCRLAMTELAIRYDISPLPAQLAKGSKFYDLPALLLERVNRQHTNDGDDVGYTTMVGHSASVVVSLSDLKNFKPSKLLMAAIDPPSSLAGDAEVPQPGTNLSVICPVALAKDEASNLYTVSVFRRDGEMIGEGSIPVTGFKVLSHLAATFPISFEHPVLKKAVGVGDAVASLDAAAKKVPALNCVIQRPGRRGKGNRGCYGLKWPE